MQSYAWPSLAPHPIRSGKSHTLSLKEYLSTYYKLLNFSTNNYYNIQASCMQSVSYVLVSLHPHENTSLLLLKLQHTQ